MEIFQLDNQKHFQNAQKAKHFKLCFPVDRCFCFAQDSAAVDYNCRILLSLGTEFWKELLGCDKCLDVRQTENFLEKGKRYPSNSVELVKIDS